MKGKIGLGVLAAVLSMPGAVCASQEPVYELQAITVTANRQAEDIQSVPANVSVVTAKQIHDRNIQTAAQAVALAPGVELDQAMEGGVSVRGYDSKNILVMVDGQRVNSGWNGEVMWNMIPVDTISKIEVVRGGQSALYGGRAVGAVINIMTQNSQPDGFHGSVLESYGTYNTVRQGYNAGIKKGRWTVSGFYENRTTDGWRTFKQYASSTSRSATLDESALKYPIQTDGAGNYIIGDRGRKSWFSENYGLQMGYEIGKDKKITYNYSHTNYNWKYGDPRTYLYTSDGTPVWNGVIRTVSGTNISVKPTNYTGTWGFREDDMHSLTYNDQKNKIHVHFGLTDFTKDGYTYATTADPANAFNGPGVKSSYPSKTMDLDMNKRWNLGGNHTLLLGAAFNREQFDQTITTISDWKDHYKSGSDTEWHGGKSQSLSAYIQDKWQISSRWTSYVGTRYDYYKKYDGYNRVLPSGMDLTYGSTSYSKVSPKLSFDYKYKEGCNFYLSYGRSFNPPLLYQIYRASPGVTYGSDRRPIIADPALKPETTDTWELGMKKKLGRGTDVNADIFFARTEDYIQMVDHGYNNSSGYTDYENMGNEKTHGVEITLDRRFNANWSAYMNYTWQIGKINGYDSDTGEMSNGRNYDIPRHLFHLGAAFTKQKWDVNVDGTFVSARNEPDVDTGAFESRDPYFLLNMNVNYKVAKDVSFQLGVYNVLNREFYDDEALSGRTYNAAVRYSF